VTLLHFKVEHLLESDAEALIREARHLRWRWTIGIAVVLLVGLGLGRGLRQAGVDHGSFS
jgi:hypothetical protein